MGALVQHAVKNENISLSEIAKEDVNKILKFTKIKIDVDELMYIIKDTTPEKSLLLRNSYGSPNPMHQKDMINSIEKSLLVYGKVISQRKKLLDAAFDNLEKEVILNTIFDNKKKIKL